MKRLLTALAVAFVATIASARIADTQLFEDSNYTNAFLPDAENEDCSVLETHASQPVIGVPYPCGGFGDKYLSLDTGDATLFRTNTVEGNVYFDMAVQFTPSAAEIDVGLDSEFRRSGAKFAIYQNMSSNIVVVCSGSWAVTTNLVTATRVDPGTWARLTVFAKNDGGIYSFQIRINGTLVENPVLGEGHYDFGGVSGGLSSSVTQVGFRGTGAVDDFVARTTDPFIAGAAATVADGNEGYASLEDALAEADANTVVTLTAAHAGTIHLDRGQSYKINLNNQEFGGFTVDMDGAHDALKVTEEGNITTYEAVAGVAYINNRPGGFATYYASVTEAMDDCTRSNFVGIAFGTNCTERVYIPADTTLYLEEMGGSFSGTFDGPGTVFMHYFPSKYKFGNGMGDGGPANGPTLFEPTWTGTFQIGWEVFNHRFVFNDFGNANSTVEIACTSTGVPYPDSEYRDFTGFPSGAWSAETNGVPVEGDGAPVILPTIKLSAPWTIGAEYGWAGSTTVIPKLTGSGDFTVFANSNRTYRIGSIEGYSGTLATHGYLLFPEGLAKPFIEIGNIVYDGTPGYDDCLVKVYKGFMESDSFWCTNLNNTTVNSSPAHLAVGTYNDVSGIYLARAAATVDGEATGYRTVEEAVVAATNTIDAATQPPTIAIYDGSTFSEAGWVSTETDGVYVFNYVKAKIGETSYFSLTEALADAAAQATDPVTVNLVAKDSETVVIPANVTLAVGGADFYNCAFTGSGAIKYSAEPVVDYMGNNLYQQLQSEGWTGTFIADYDVGTLGLYSFNFNNFGNTGSTVEIPEGQTVSGFIANYNPGETVTVNPTVKVSGTLEIVNGNADRTNVFTRISGAGTVTFSKNQGNELGCYRVGSLEDWNGTFTVEYSSDQNMTIGTIASGSGTVALDYEPKVKPTFGEGWSGTVRVGWDPNGRFNFNDYGTSNSTVEIDAWNGFQENAPVTILPTVKVDRFMTMTDGYTTEAKKTVFTAISGAGDLNFTKGNVNGDFYYEIAKLNNYTGTICVNNGSYSSEYSTYRSTYVKVGVVNMSVEPAVNTKIVGASLGNYGDIRNASNESAKGGALFDVTVDDVASDTKLVYGGDGLYVAVASVTANDATTYYESLAAAAAAAVDAGVTEFSLIREEAGTTLVGWIYNSETRKFTKNAAVAAIGSTEYETLSAAIGAAGENDTVTLIANVSEAIALAKTVALDVGSYAYTGTLSGAGTLKLKKAAALHFGEWTGTVVIDWTISSSGAAFNFNDYGIAGSTVEVNEWYGWQVKDESTVTVAPTVKIGTTFTTTSGYASGTVDGNLTTFTEIAGSGWFNLIWATQYDNYKAYYAVTTIDTNKFTGGFSVYAKNRLTIGEIVCASAPSVGDKLYTVWGSGEVYGSDGTTNITIKVGGQAVPNIAAAYFSNSSGLYVISTAGEETPVTPGQTDGKIYNDQASAEAAAAKVAPAASEAVAAELGEDATAAYLDNFEAKVVDNGNNTYSVVVDLTDAAKTELADEATTNVAVAVASQLSEIAADATGEQTEVTVTGATPGFYYSISYGTSVDSIDVEGDRAMADKDGSVTITTPAKDEGATSGFYKVNINVAPKPVNP